MASNKQKAATANKRARDQRESMVIGAQLGIYGATVVGETAKALTPALPYVGDVGLDLGLGVASYLLSMVGKKGGAVRMAGQVAGARFISEGLSGLIDMYLPGDE